MPTLDEHGNTIQILGLMIVFIVAGIGMFSSRVSSEFRIADGVLVALTAWPLWRAIRSRRKTQ